ncbi:MAG: lipoyl synthase [Tenuifilum sp.]|mgnify:FL=1|uniref:lipoyl synthase n=1 Tax=Tenuifilum sp. TaxID=2760880 RepID=UPI002CBDA9D8|nr:lipoyl synthase [Tenuifilum sp.]HRU86607.1 lipoyl synthase [Tenuifilum sp.]
MGNERKPEWLKIKLPGGEGYAQVNSIVKKHGLHTICSSGMCPNIGECWGNGVATLMILGDICTRSCKFCATATGKPLPPDPNEPTKVARTVSLMGLSYCVITSVDRDDLPDHGAGHWRSTVMEIRRVNPNTTIEVLIPDFDGRPELIDLFLESEPDVVGHNLETVERLTPLVRTKASYRRSLKVLEHIAKRGFRAKSGIMLGLGETRDELIQTLDDLLAVGCQMVTIGQYLQPRPTNLPVQRYITPEEFEEYKQIALAKGFEFAESGPLVRSSYHADKAQHLVKGCCK